MGQIKFGAFRAPSNSIWVYLGYGANQNRRLAGLGNSAKPTTKVWEKQQGGFPQAGQDLYAQHKQSRVSCVVISFSRITQG